jgi:hypothetical protein
MQNNIPTVRQLCEIVNAAKGATRLLILSNASITPVLNQAQLHGLVEASTLSYHNY